MKKYALVFIVSILLVGLSTIVPNDTASAHTVNSCPDLKSLTDPLAIELEKTAGAKVIWTNVHSDLVNAKNKYEKAIKEKGWTISYTSAYRPQQYQEHFAEIVSLANANKASACVLAEKAYHGLGKQAAKTVSNHTRGLAFDAVIKDKTGKKLNSNGNISSELVAVAKSAGLKFPHPSDDAVHHELVTPPKTSTTQTNSEYVFSATGKLTETVSVYKAANTTSGSYGIFSAGKSVTIVGVVGDFYKIKYNQGFAYVKGVTKGVTVTVTEKAMNATATITSSNGFNVRQYPYDSAKLLKTVAKNKSITILAVSGDWYKVKVDNVTGYLKGVKSGVTIKQTTNSTNPPAVSEYPKTGYVNTASTALNVRKTASASGTLLGTVAKGSTLTVTGKTGNFYSIKYNATTIGYVSADYVTFTKPATPAPAYPKVGYVNTASTALNVRKTASETGALLGQVAKGKELTVTGESGKFYKITFNNQTGYVSKDYITFTKPSTPSPAYPKTGYVNTASTALNVRKTASETGALLGQVAKGKELTVTGESGKFYKITFNKQTGYVSKDYITFTKPSTTYPITGYVKTQQTGLNVRKTASTSGEIIGQVLKGKSVKITGKTGNWYIVSFGTTIGYVSADYITFNKTEAGKIPTLASDINKALTPSKGKLATISTFNGFMPTLESIEGGYSDHPKDTGGKTNLGVTEKLYLTYYPKGSIYTITKAEATHIYKTEFWNKQKLEGMSERLAVVLFDTSVNQGNYTAAKILQLQLGLKADGIIGSNTANTVKRLTIVQQDALALKILQIRKNYRPNTADFQAGWANRDKRVYDYIKNL